MDCHYVILGADNNFSFFFLAFLPCAWKAFWARLSIIINNTHCASHIVKLIHFTFLTVISLCELSIRFLCAARKSIRGIIFHFSKTVCIEKCFDYFIECAIVKTASMEYHLFITDFIIRCTYEPTMILKYQISEK